MWRFAWCAGFLLGGAMLSAGVVAQAQEKDTKVEEQAPPSKSEIRVRTVAMAQRLLDFGLERKMPEAILTGALKLEGSGEGQDLKPLLAHAKDLRPDDAALAKLVDEALVEVGDKARGSSAGQTGGNSYIWQQYLPGNGQVQFTRAFKAKETMTIWVTSRTYSDIDPRTKKLVTNPANDLRFYVFRIEANGKETKMNGANGEFGKHMEFSIRPSNEYRYRIVITNPNRDKALVHVTTN